MWLSRPNPIFTDTFDLSRSFQIIRCSPIISDIHRILTMFYIFHILSDVLRTLPFWHLNNSANMRCDCKWSVEIGCSDCRIWDTIGECRIVRWTPEIIDECQFDRKNSAKIGCNGRLASDVICECRLGRWVSRTWVLIGEYRYIWLTLS